MEVGKIEVRSARFRAVNPEKLCTARFMERPNRFLLRCDLDGQTIEAFLPNPGRLWEILLPGTEVLLSKDGKSQTRKTAYTAVAARKGDIFILLHTHLANDVVGRLLAEEQVPGLEGWTVKKREAVFGRSRFDFLLEKDDKRLFLEVKSCTLFGRRLAMFPDAPSDRGRKHVEELAGLLAHEARGAVLILVQSDVPEYFLPDFHTDPKFAQSLYNHKNKIGLIPLGVSWTRELELSDNPRLLDIPWEIYERHSPCPGVSIVSGERTGGGHWAYVLDETNPAGWSEFVRKSGWRARPYVMPIRSASADAGQINRELGLITDGEEDRDGRRFFFFRDPPLKNPSFASMLLHQRTDRLLEDQDQRADE